MECNLIWHAQGANVFSVHSGLSLILVSPIHYTAEQELSHSPAHLINFPPPPVFMLPSLVWPTPSSACLGCSLHCWPEEGVGRHLSPWCQPLSVSSHNIQTSDPRLDCIRLWPRKESLFKQQRRNTSLIFHKWSRLCFLYSHNQPRGTMTGDWVCALIVFSPCPPSGNL